MVLTPNAHLKASEAVEQSTSLYCPVTESFGRDVMEPTYHCNECNQSTDDVPVIEVSEDVLEAVFQSQG